MIHQDSVATYGILCSASLGAAQRSVFSCPVFRASLLPQSLIDGETHLQLLKVEAKPRVFNFLLEGYPGKEYMAYVAAAGQATTRGGGGTWTCLVEFVKVMSLSSQGLSAPIMGQPVELPILAKGRGVINALMHMIWIPLRLLSPEISMGHP